MSSPSRPGPADLVATYWPPLEYDPDALASALNTAAALVRFSNHAAIHTTDTMPRANDIEKVTTAQYEMVAGLPQLIQKARGRLEHLAAEDPTLYADTGDASNAATSAGNDLARAEALAEQLAAALDSAHQHLSNLGQLDPEPGQ